MEQPIGESVIDIVKTIAPLTVMKNFFDPDSVINKEASLNMMMKFIEKDKIANDLYNGTFNSDVLRTEQEELATGVPQREGKRGGNID